MDKILSYGSLFVRHSHLDGDVVLRKHRSQGTQHGHSARVVKPTPAAAALLGTGRVRPLPLHTHACTRGSPSPQCDCMRPGCCLGMTVLTQPLRGLTGIPGVLAETQTPTARAGCGEGPPGFLFGNENGCGFLSPLAEYTIYLQGQ